MSQTAHRLSPDVYTAHIPEHNYKLLAENTTLYFIYEVVAKDTRDKLAKSGVKAHIMLKLPNGSYIPLAE